MKHYSSRNIDAWSCANGGPSPASQCRTRIDLALPPYAVASGRLQLPASADVLGLWGRGDRAVWMWAGGWITLARLCAASPVARRASTMCRRQRRPAHAGIFLGATAAGAASTHRSSPPEFRGTASSQTSIAAVRELWRQRGMM